LLGAGKGCPEWGTSSIWVWLIDLCPYIGHKSFLWNTIFKCYSIIYLYNILWYFAKLERSTASFSCICPLVHHPYLRKQNVVL
jgi:hypothetical protein